jgi:hypothetical protein
VSGQLHVSAAFPPRKEQFHILHYTCAVSVTGMTDYLELSLRGFVEDVIYVSAMPVVGEVLEIRFAGAV